MNTAAQALYLFSFPPFPATSPPSLPKEGPAQAQTLNAACCYECLAGGLVTLAVKGERGNEIEKEDFGG